MPKPHKIKYSKDLQWLSPFVDSVHHLVPTHLLDSVSSYKVALGKTENVDAAVHQLRGRYTITIRAYKHLGRKRKYDAEPVENILLYVAHELAHLCHWNHNIEFARLMSTLFSVFVEQMDRYGIPDIQIRHNRIKTSQSVVPRNDS